jgi:hypothetical protein
MEELFPLARNSCSGRGPVNRMIVSSFEELPNPDSRIRRSYATFPLFRGTLSMSATCTRRSPDWFGPANSSKSRRRSKGFLSARNFLLSTGPWRPPSATCRLKIAQWARRNAFPLVEELPVSRSGKSCEFPLCEELALQAMEPSSCFLFRGTTFSEQYIRLNDNVPCAEAIAITFPLFEELATLHVPSFLRSMHQPSARWALFRGTQPR